MHWYGDDPGWGMWSFMIVVMLPIWAALVLGGLALVRALWRDVPRGDDGRDSARRLLQERFARGEIDEAEYTRSREVLGLGH